MELDEELEKESETRNLIDNLTINQNEIYQDSDDEENMIEMMEMDQNDYNNYEDIESNKEIEEINIVEFVDSLNIGDEDTKWTTVLYSTQSYIYKTSMEMFGKIYKNVLKNLKLIVKTGTWENKMQTILTALSIILTSLMSFFINNYYTQSIYIKTIYEIIEKITPHLNVLSMLNIENIMLLTALGVITITFLYLTLKVVIKVLRN